MTKIDQNSIEPQAPDAPKKVITAAVIGGALEWYDFGAYALFAVTIATQFFPTHSENASVLLSLATFSVGFIARPIGAIFLGAYADRVGRKSVLSLTMLLMALGMALIAICPTYEQFQKFFGFEYAGLLAPIIIVIARLIQGVSAGGEIGSALSIIVESAPAHKRGQYAAWQQVSQTGAFLVAGTVGWIITTFVPFDWGWRLAFVFGMLVAPVGFYIRTQISESAEFLEQKAKETEKEKLNPIKLTFKDHAANFVKDMGHYWKFLLIGIGVVIVWTVVSKTASGFMPTYAHNYLKMPKDSPYLGMIVVGIVLLFCPFIGAWSDKIGRRPIMIGAAIAMFIFAYPSFALLSAYPFTWVLILQQFFYALLMIFYTAPASALLSEIFPTKFRSSGISLSYNTAVTIFGGFAPPILAALINVTGDNKSVAYYIMFAAAISVVALLFAGKISSKSDTNQKIFE